MSALVIENGFLTLNGKRYSEMNWFEMREFNINLEFERKKFQLKLFKKKQRLSLILEEMEEKKTTPKSGKPKFN